MKEIRRKDMMKYVGSLRPEWTAERLGCEMGHAPGAIYGCEGNRVNSGEEGTARRRIK